MNILKTFSSRKLRQYELESEFDFNLKNANLVCPVLVAEFLLVSRELNRKLGTSICSSSILNYSSNMEKHISTHEEIYKNVDKLDGVELSCRNLPWMIMNLEEIMKKS